MEERSEVASYIKDRVKNITNDSRTFLLVRTSHVADIGDEELHIGGGNLLIAMGNFAIFEYLSRIYFGLTNDENKWFDPKDNWKFKHSADECFVNLILNNKSGISFGLENLKPDELKDLWNEWRNKLSHLLCQNEKHSSISFLPVGGVNQRKSYLNFINSKTLNRIAFIKEGQSWKCFIDILNRDLDKVASWVADDVLEKARDGNITKIHTWLVSNLRV